MLFCGLTSVIFLAAGKCYLCKVRKVFLSILLMSFIISSSGLAIELHYCMGRLAEVELPGEEHDRCGLCGMKDKAGCCHDELKFFKLDDSYKHIQNDISLASPVKMLAEPEDFFFSFATAFTTQLISARQIHGPPDLSGKERCDLYCIYRL